MTFAPQAAGDYEHYVYAGQQHDIDVNSGHVPYGVVIDSAGRLYVDAGGERIERFSTGAPAPPTCGYTVPGFGIEGLTVNTSTGEPYFFSYKNRKIHRLTACNSAGQFEPTAEEFAPLGSPTEVNALAVNPSLSYGSMRPEGIIYALASGEGPQGTIFAPAPVNNPSVETEFVTDVGVGSATLHALVNPRGSQTSYVFQYLTEAVYQANEPDETQLLVISATGGSFVLGFGAQQTATIPFDATAGEVRRALEGLPSIGGGAVEVSGGPGDGAGSIPYKIVFVGALANSDLPQLSSTSQGLTGGAATAVVSTDHNGGAGFSSGATEAPIGPAVLGSGQSPVPASVTVSTLAPGTNYRYRIVATSGGSAAGSPGAFRTYPAEEAGLPDHRAWELVSPVEKSGGEVFPVEPLRGNCTECKPGALGPRFPIQSSPTGEAIVYEGDPFSISEGAASYNEYLSTRSEAGWQTKDLSPLLQSRNEDEGHQAFTPALTRSVFYQTKPSLSSEVPHETPDLYLQDSASPQTFIPLPNVVPRDAGSEFSLTYAGSSSDLGDVFFEANDALTEETPFAPPAVFAGTGKTNLYEAAGGKLTLVNVQPGNGTTVPGAVFGSGYQLAGVNEFSDLSHAISADGSKTFWSSEAGQVYLRENGQITVEVPDHGGKFLTASSDGSKLLLSDGNLFNTSNFSEPPIDLTSGEGGFQGLLGQSDDLSSIYFVDTAVLTGGEENHYGHIANSGGDNLYFWRDGTLSFVATLAAQDSADWSASVASRTAEASPDGTRVAFTSMASVTGPPSVGPCAAEGSGKIVTGACDEVYLYNAVGSRIACPSCNPTGAAPLGNSALIRIFNSAGALPQPRYLTDSGRLFFDSQDALSSFDTNGRFEDVYEYEESGTGTCAQTDGGCVALLSGGDEAVDSNLLAVDLDGNNVFFTSREQLLATDPDQLIDLYDARVGGGFSLVAPVAQCEGEACQAPSPPPVEGRPSSELANREDSRAPRSCPKHKVRRSGRCVKKVRRRSSTKKKGKGQRNASHRRKSTAGARKGGTR